ncbi:MAG: hypothetical protein HYZ53_30535 [Planctomycetes bacterium]|nr:hypothetical protein [Planctomycetota bacterium]
MRLAAGRSRHLERAGPEAHAALLHAHGGGNHFTRDAAASALFHLGKEVVPALEAAASGEDAAIAAEAKAILERLRRE